MSNKKASGKLEVLGRTRADPAITHLPRVLGKAFLQDLGFELRLGTATWPPRPTSAEPLASCVSTQAGPAESREADSHRPYFW